MSAPPASSDLAPGSRHAQPLDLVFVQAKPTQFDEPLFDYLARSERLRFLVCYWDTQRSNAMLDPEIGRAPIWDHTEGMTYPRRDLTPEQCRHPSSVAREIVRLSPRLVILGGYSPRLYALLALSLKLLGVRIGLRSDNTLRHATYRGSKGLLKRLALPGWLSLYDTWHPVGSLAQEFLSHTAMCGRPTFFFPYAVDAAWVARHAGQAKRQREVIRTSLGIDRDALVILGVLKWHQREDPLTLVDAFVALASGHREVHLVLVGDGPLRAVVEKRLRPWAHRVTLPGYVPYSALPGYYGIADVFVHPACGEPWGVSVNEAMAAGLPALAAEGVGAGRDLIERNVTGDTFPDRDVAKLIALLERLTGEPRLLREMSQGALARAERWGYERTATELQSCLESL